MDSVDENYEVKVLYLLHQTGKTFPIAQSWANLVILYRK